MDPDVALQQIREVLAEYHQAAVDDDPNAANVAMSALAEIVEGLDEWLTKGGFPPSQWQRLRTLTFAETERVGRVTFAVSHEATTMGLNWHDLQHDARRYWEGLASTAIDEYLRQIGYLRLPLGEDTVDQEEATA